MTARAASLKLIKVQTVLIECAVNLRVSFALNNTESVSQQKSQTHTVKINGKKIGSSIKLHVSVHNISVIGKSCAQTSTLQKSTPWREKHSIIGIYRA